MFEVLGYKNKQNLLGIISKGRFKQVGVREKKMTEMRSIAGGGGGGHCVWLIIWVTISL